MRVGMNLGFGERVGRATLKRVRRWGCRAVRTDAWLAGSHGSQAVEVPAEVLEGYVEDARDLDLEILWLLSRPLRTGAVDRDAMQRRAAWIAERLPCGAGINGGWEGNDSKEPWSAADMAQIGNLVREAVPAEIPVWLNVANNTTRLAYDYTRRVLDAGLHEGIGLDLHPYQTTNLFGLPNNAGFSSQEEMWRAHLELGRRLIVGECGATAARQGVGGWVIAGKRYGGRVVQYTDGQIADYTSLDLQRHADYGVEQSHRFQLNDGPTDHYEHRHGFLTHPDGFEKLCVTSLKAFEDVPAPAAAYEVD